MTRNIQRQLLAHIRINLKIIINKEDIAHLGIFVVACYDRCNVFKGFKVTRLSNQSFLNIGDIVVKINEIDLPQLRSSKAYQTFIEEMETKQVKLEIYRKKSKENIKNEEKRWILITIKLKKFITGFGFNLSFCEDRVDGNIYVKKITSDHCQNSGLRENDTILIIGEEHIITKDQACEILRNINIGDWIELKISRHAHIVCGGKLSLLVAFAETQSAGLGISLKTINGTSAGIYIGSVLKGGALWKDGRAKDGDRIMAINSVSIENEKSVEIALNKLIMATQKKSPYGKFFSLILHRHYESTSMKNNYVYLKFRDNKLFQYIDNNRFAGLMRQDWRSTTSRISVHEKGINLSSH